MTHLIDGLTRNEFVDTPYQGEELTTSGTLVPNGDGFVLAMRSNSALARTLQDGTFGLSRDGLRALVALGTRMLGDGT